MALLECPKPFVTSQSELVTSHESLKDWQWIGEGGFGEIFKANHTTLKIEVAVKLLRSEISPGSSLLKEAELMKRYTNPYVLMIYGVYRGPAQVVGGQDQIGLVMEYMKRGTLKDLQEILQKDLCEPRFCSLAFRIIYQIALGMNFLHQLSPPLLHLDLKPSNVLLDDSLNAKITDFGLAKIVQNNSKRSSDDDPNAAGTTKYMPPEAFEKSYVPNFSSDIYSYGILLWSIVTGEEPYSNAFVSSHVRYRITEGDRPNLKLIDCRRAKELDDLIDLMQDCWNGSPELRPTFMDCIEITQKRYKLHEKDQFDAVSSVLKRMDKLSSTFESLSITHTTKNSFKKASSHAVKADARPTQESGATSKSKPTGDHTSRPLPSSPGLKYKSGAKAPCAPRRHLNPERQHSTPDPKNIIISNSTGVQFGKNNIMNINMPPERQRQRHSTAPSKVNYSNLNQPSNQERKPDSSKP